MTDLQDTVDEIFSETGVLSSRPDFEYRPQQRVMAVSIAEALEDGDHLIVEAPTGVGKTLAYLVPSVLFALRENRKAIISTHTKNLQEQLYQKDIPIVRSILSQPFSPITLKGRKNYLCSTRLHNALAAGASLFGDEHQQELKKIYEWSLHTVDGDVERLGFAPTSEVWDMVCAEQDICSPALCGTRCFYQQAKEHARSAHVVIMNHALFFNLMALQETEERYIFDGDFVVFDEAHTLEAVAGSGLSRRVSRRQFLIAMHHLYNPRTRKGLLAQEKKKLLDLCARLEQETNAFFDSVRQAGSTLEQHHESLAGTVVREIRVRTPHLVANTIAEPLADLRAQVQKLEERTAHSSTKQELAAACRSLQEAQTLVEEFLEQVEPEFTYWVELPGGRSDNVTLSASPSEVGNIIGPQLFREGSSVVMTSATLSVGNSTEYFQRRIGAAGVRSMILDSPFDHRKQMRVSIARDIPEPDSDEYSRDLPSWILQSIDRSHGRALVLFTSASLMRVMADELAEAFEERGITLLVQGYDQQRHRLLEEFKRDIQSVLFGLDSFWTGIDVPGEALEHVIITRLPFAVPNHPLIEARMEAIAKRGGNSFLEYSLPEAVLRFRQGVGRLIRTREDRGVVTILDSRILHKRYGAVFLSSIPRCPVDLLTAMGAEEEAGFWDW